MQTYIYIRIEEYLKVCAHIQQMHTALTTVVPQLSVMFEKNRTCGEQWVQFQSQHDFSLRSACYPGALVVSLFLQALILHQLPKLWKFSICMHYDKLLGFYFVCVIWAPHVYFVLFLACPDCVLKGYTFVCRHRSDIDRQQCGDKDRRTLLWHEPTSRLYVFKALSVS